MSIRRGKECCGFEVLAVSTTPVALTTAQVTPADAATEGYPVLAVIAVETADIRVRSDPDAATDLTTAAVKATAVIGSGDNGTVTTEVDAAGTAGNAYTIEVEVAAGLNEALAAAIVAGAITVTLGTDGAGAPDATKNTATLVAAAVSGLAGVTASASGTGADALSAAEGPTSFTGGLDVIGHKKANGAEFEIEGRLDLQNFRAVRHAGVDAAIQVAYYRNVQGLS